MSEICAHDWEQLNPRQKKCRKCFAHVIRPAPTPTCSAIGCTRPGMFLAIEEDKPVCDVHVSGGLLQ